MGSNEGPLTYKVLADTPGKKMVVAGSEFYLEITAKKGYYEVFDGKVAFHIYKLTRDGLKHLKETGQLAEDFAGIVRVVDKGHEIKTDLDITDFNERVKLDVSTPEVMAILLREGFAVPSKLTFEKGAKGTTVLTPVSVLDKDLKDFKPEDYMQKKLLKNTKKYEYGTPEFSQLYLTELEALDKAIEAYKNGNPAELQKFFAALIKTFDGKVTPSYEVVDLMIAFMCKVEKAGLDFKFSGTSAYWEGTNEGEPVTLDNVGEIVNASKTKEGRTWLVGILQEWEKARLKELSGKGYATIAEQAAVLDYIAGKFVYRKGKYREYQEKYLEARQTGDLKKVGEIINPVDYVDVAERTGGDGWKALGPSTIGSLMFILGMKKEEEPPKPKEKKYTEPVDMVLEGTTDARLVGRKIVLEANAWIEGQKVLPEEFIKTAKPEFTYYLIEHVPEQTTLRIFGFSVSKAPERYFLVLPENALMKKDKEGEEAGYDASDLFHRFAYLKKAEGGFDVCIYLKDGKLVDPTNISKMEKEEFENEVKKGLQEVVLGDAVIRLNKMIALNLNDTYEKQYSELIYGKLDPAKDIEQNKDGTLTLEIKGKGDVGENCTYTANVSVRYIRQQEIQEEEKKSGVPSGGSE